MNNNGTNMNCWCYCLHTAGLLSLLEQYVQSSHCP